MNTQNMKPGDWFCSGCGDLNFAKNMQCRKCGTPHPEHAQAWTGNHGGGMGTGGTPAAMATMAMMASGGCGSGNLKPGDWICQACGDLQFAKNTSCRKCGAPSPAIGGGGHPTMSAMGAMGGMSGGSHPNFRPGDWMCPNCSNHVYARNPSCPKCSTPKPEGAEAAAAVMMSQMAGMGHPNFKPGDWLCSSCNNHVFAKHPACPKCGATKPEGAEAASMATMGMGGGGVQFLSGTGFTPKPGDWECPSCGDLQFARNMACRKCNAPRPEGAGGSSQVAQPGDWACPACNDLQFARNMACRRCGAPKPAGGGHAAERERSPRRQ